MGDMANYIALAVPVFFLLIGAELVWARFESREVARLNDAVTDISCGTVQQVLGLFTMTAVFAVYVLIHEHARLFDVPKGSAWAWVLCFLGVDFFYYWFHRSSHELNFAWAAHVVHHQSEDYNLSVALRQSALQQFISAPFYWPLAFLGFPPEMFLAASAFNTLYQFWIHTELIGRLGPLEWFLNTPSHHRVHHGSNPQYIDRNHGGTLIVWDRFFGTFEPEDEKVVYGVTKPPASWNPLWVNFHYLGELWRLSKKTGSWRNRLLLWVKPPGWLPADVDEPPERENALHGVRYDASSPEALDRYVLVHFVAAMVLAFLYLFRFGTLEPEWKAALGLLLIWSVLNLGAIFEGRRWLPVSEVARLMAAVALIAVVARTPGLLVGLGVAGIAAILSAIWLFRYRNHFIAASV